MGLCVDRTAIQGSCMTKNIDHTYGWKEATIVLKGEDNQNLPIQYFQFYHLHTLTDIHHQSHVPEYFSTFAVVY